MRTNAVCLLLVVVTFLPLAWRTAATELPVLPDSAGPFSFVVLGDLHYKRPQFATARIVAEIARSIQNCDPPVVFVCHTGDLAEGGTYEVANGKRVFRQATHEELAEELAFAVKDVTGQFRLPLFMAVGNHDEHAGGRAFAGIIPPLISRELGAPVQPGGYGFRYGNSCFVFLEVSAPDLAAQQKRAGGWLESARAAGVRHVFLFAHYPLWPLVRPGFSSERFTDSVLPLFKQIPVDAFFCGHTHNSCAWVRRVDGFAVTQIQGVACQASTELVPMEERRTLLMPLESFDYYWGCLSGPPAGHFLVTVDGDQVRVQFRSAARVIREFGWREPGRITDVRKTGERMVVPVTPEQLRQARSANIVVCPWAEDRVETGVWLNGERVAGAELGPLMRANSFVVETRIPIPAGKLGALALANDLAFDNPGLALFAIGHACLEVTLADGRVARTGAASRFFFSATEAEGNAAGRNHGWRVVPPAVRSEAGLGRPAGPMRLCFPVAPPGTPDGR